MVISSSVNILNEFISIKRNVVEIKEEIQEIKNMFRSHNKLVVNDKQKNYEPETTIRIEIGKKNHPHDLGVVKVFINDEKIENLQGFKFEVDLNQAPEIVIKKHLYNRPN